jgi:hypothetical protein
MQQRIGGRGAGGMLMLRIETRQAEGEPPCVFYLAAVEPEGSAGSWAPGLPAVLHVLLCLLSTEQSQYL